MAANDGKDYYLNLKPELLQAFDEDAKFLAKSLREHFDQAKIDLLLAETRQGYEDLIPGLPYVGGRENFLTPSLIMSAWCLPMFRVLERKGLSIRDMAKVVYEKYEAECESKSIKTRRRVRDFYFSDGMREAEMKRSGDSQLRRYPGDWVSEYVEGDGRTFDFGIDFTECGIRKFYEPLGAGKYAPIFCLTDYANYRALGVGFRRTQTMTTGASFCDFRFSKEIETPRGWPPENLEEHFPF